MTFGRDQRLAVWLFLGAVALAALVFGVILLLEGRGIGHAPLIGESGLVQIGSAILWFASAATLLFSRRNRFASRLEPLVLSYLCAILGLRELDANKRVFEWNLTKLYNLVKPEIAVTERALALLFIYAPLVIALVLVWKLRLRHARRDEKRLWVVWAAGWLGLLVMAYVADKFSWLSELMGIAIARSFPARALEESLELSLAIYTFAGILLVIRSKPPKTAVAPSPEQTA